MGGEGSQAAGTGTNDEEPVASEDEREEWEGGERKAGMTPLIPRGEIRRYPPSPIFGYNQGLKPRRLCMRHSMNTMRLLLLSSILSVLALTTWADAKAVAA